MKICYISNPNSTHTYRWVNWFARRGNQVCLICDNPIRNREDYSGIELYDLPARINLPMVKYLPWILWTKRIIRDWQPDVLHAHRITGAGWLGAFSGFHPFVVTPWGSDLYRYPYQSKIGRWLTFYVLSKADQVTCDSDDLRKQALLFGANPQHVHLLQWGVDSNLFTPTQHPDHIKSHYGIHNRRVVLCPRPVHPLYNQETVVKSIPKVIAAFPETAFVFRDYNTDPIYKSKLVGLVSELGIAESVHWIGPLDPWERVVETYQMADIVVSVPNSDGTPVSVLEAMSCGAAIIASDVPSLREWIIPGENGLLVPTGDVLALAEAIIHLLKSPQEREKYKQHNQGLIRERADHQLEMEKMEHLYSQLQGISSGMSQ